MEEGREERTEREEGKRKSRQKAQRPRLLCVPCLPEGWHSGGPRYSESRLRQTHTHTRARTPLISGKQWTLFGRALAKVYSLALLFCSSHQNSVADGYSSIPPSPPSSFTTLLLHLSHLANSLSSFT